MGPIDLRTSIQGIFHGVAQRYVQQHVQGLAPPYSKPATGHLLVVTCCQGEPVIIEVEPSGAVGQLEGYGFAAIGSGGPYAHAIFMRFRNKIIPLDLAEVIAYRAVDEAIEVASYGLSAPIWLWTIRAADNQGMDVRRLEGDDLERVKYALNMWRDSELQSLPTGVELPDRPTPDIVSGGLISNQQLGEEPPETTG
jgi:hypothetical protein